MLVLILCVVVPAFFFVGTHKYLGMINYAGAAATYPDKPLQDLSSGGPSSPSPPASFVFRYYEQVEISFVIPAYNEEHRIAGCLHAIEEELMRVGIKAEVIVVNNGSSDRTAEIARSFAGVRVVDEATKGLVAARHAGYIASKGELVANVDADTIMPAQWLAKALREFRKDPKLVALSGPYIYYDLAPWERALVRVFYFAGYVSYLFAHYVLKSGAMLQGGNFVIRRSAMDRAGGFDTSISFYGEDTDVAKRMSKVGKVKWTWALPMYTSGRRLAEEGLWRMGVRYALNYFSILFTGRPWTAHYTDIR